MKLRITIMCSVIILLGSSALKAQKTEEEKKFGISFSGFVKNDAFYDSRQIANIREGHFSLYPLNVSNDANGDDMNAKSNFNILSIQTRLSGKITGTDAFGAKTSGMIEGEFFGTSDADVNGFRLRHAVVKFNWEKSELMAGQFWNPLFFTQSYPEVISFNTGVPFQPFARNPQLRYTYKLNDVSLAVTAYTLRDFQATGPSTGTTIQKNAGIPNLNFAVVYQPAESKNVFGAGFDYKTVRPRLNSEVVITPETTVVDTNTWVVTKVPAVVKKYSVDETLSGLSATAFSKLVFGKITWKLQALYAQNSYDIMGIGGYAVKFNTTESVTGAREYTNFNTGSGWTEVYYTGEKFVVGLFAGYTKNLGTNDQMEGGDSKIFARENKIEYIYRISPRVAFKQGKSTIAFELEYTTAAYGKATDIDNMGKFTASEEVSNIRGLLSFIYNF